MYKKTNAAISTTYNSRIITKLKLKLYANKGNPRN